MQLRNQPLSGDAVLRCCSTWIYPCRGQQGLSEASNTVHQAYREAKALRVIRSRVSTIAASWSLIGSMVSQHDDGSTGLRRLLASTKLQALRPKPQTPVVLRFEHTVEHVLEVRESQDCYTLLQ